jgi:hypothetical protein
MFRSNLLVILVVALALAAAWVVWPFGGSGSAGQAVPRPLQKGDQEVAWLNPATAVNWERFVSAARRFVAEHKQFALDDSNAFPSQTTAVPELALSAGSGKPRLWFRWYKLTGDLGTRQWVQALGQRQPPPLAIIGGGTSDRARDLARELNDLPDPPSAKPLLLITTATAGQIYLDDQETNLMEIYPGRSFRFCFTNRQMAKAVSDFIWQRDDLRPDGKPIYLVQWKDDPYSEDLSEQFHDVLANYLDRLPSEPAGKTAPPPAPFWSQNIPYSVGGYNQPNEWEAEAVERLMNNVSLHPEQERRLLVLPAIPQPARRFLRGLARTDPVQAGRFVVATGDGIDFNTIYRDRNLAWPIQDLPCALVFFCHRNPVDPSAFREDEPGSDPAPPNPNEKTTTGTQDLLLFQDIVEAVVTAAAADKGWLEQPDDLERRLHQAKLQGGHERFNARGNQFAEVGEYVVVLRPIRRDGNRVLPRASLQVWNGSTQAEGPGVWALVRELTVDYLGKSSAVPPEGAP